MLKILSSKTIFKLTRSTTLELNSTTKVKQPNVNQPNPKKVQLHFDERAATYSDLFDDSVRTGAGRKFRCRRDIVNRLLAGQSGRMLECATETATQ